MNIKYKATDHATPNFICEKGVCLLKVFPRVHMFSLDLSDKSGIIKHGSIGFSINNLPVVIRATKSKSHRDKIKSNLDLSLLDNAVDFSRLRNYLGLDEHWEIHIKVPRVIRSHCGLGLSTQIIGGVLLCCAKISNRSLTIEELFQLGVGHSSTLGLNLLFNNGFIIEFGCKSSKGYNIFNSDNNFTDSYNKPVECILNVDFPYYTILAIPKHEKGISGDSEANFWSQLLPDNTNNTDAIAYEVFEGIVPAIVCNDFEDFLMHLNKAISIGTKIKEEEQQSEETKKMLQLTRDLFGFAGISSMGPTIYSFSKDSPDKFKSRLPSSDGYQILILKGVKNEQSNH